MIGICNPAIISDADLAPPRMTHSESIKALIEVLDEYPQLEIPVTHRFSPGIYCREVTMPAGATVVGHKHKTRHQNIALTGRALVQIDGITTEIVAPFIFESDIGAQKTFHVLEELRWITIHANPQNITCIQSIEDEIFDLPQEIKESGMTLDDYRMTHRSPCLEL